MHSELNLEELKKHLEAGYTYQLYMKAKEDLERTKVFAWGFFCVVVVESLVVIGALLS